jgi:hypothetical protein
VHQVVSHANAVERWPERYPIETVTRDNLRVTRHPRPQVLWTPREAANVFASVEQRAREPATDVSGGAGDEDQRTSFRHWAAFSR